MKSNLLIDSINDSKNEEIQYETIEPQIKNNNQQIIEHSNYFPFENSKNEGIKNFISSKKEKSRTETQKINKNEKRQLLNINIGTNLSFEPIGIKNNYTHLIVQRDINFIIDKTFINFIENGNQTIKEKNNSDKLSNENGDNNNLKSLKIKQNKKSQKISQSIENNIQRRKAYIRKINITKKNSRENGITNNNKNQNNLNYNINKNEINDINDMQISRNNIIKLKMQTQNTFQESNLKKDNLKENNILNNDSLSDFLDKNRKCNSLVNHSFEMKDNINFFDSLNLFNSNIKDNINNSIIVDKSFLSGIKNEARKNALKNALLIYNRYKNINKLENLNIFTSPFNSNKKETNTKNNELNINNKKEEKK